jgi:hypothetical protein
MPWADDESLSANAHEADADARRRASRAGQGRAATSGTPMVVLDQNGRHRAPALEDGTRIYAIGDIHGQIECLQAAIARIVADRKARPQRTREDWRELGIETAPGVAQRGIAAGAIFALTAQAGLAAPFAGAFVSSAMGVVTLVGDYQSRKIDIDQFIEPGMLTCCEGAVVGLAVAAGQAMIPIPIVGAMIGGLAGRLLFTLAQDQLDEAETKFAARMAEMHEYVLAGLDRAYRDLIEQLDRYFDDLATLTSRAFNLELNAELRFIASVQLAQFYGVDAGRMIRSRDELDGYMTS